MMWERRFGQSMTEKGLRAAEYERKADRNGQPLSFFSQFSLRQSPHRPCFNIAAVAHRC